MATPRTESNGRIVKRDDKPQKSDLQSLLQRMTPEIARALPKHVNPDRMARIALTALRTTPKLAQCTPESFLGCIVQAAQLGLEVNTPLGQAYLLPFNNQCQLIVGYQGMLDLARRSGMVQSIYAFPVYQGDTFEWELGLDPTIRHKPSSDELRGSGERNAPRLTHVYAVAKLTAGEPIFTVLTRAEVDRYRKRSRAANNGPWSTDFEAMCLKTAIRRLFRWLPKSAEMARAEAFDEAPELGKSQLGAADPEVIGLLQAQGLDPIETEAEHEGEPEPPHDPDTGEVLEREPGAEG